MKIYGFIKIYDFGVYYHFVEDNKYVSRGNKEMIEWYEIGYLNKGNCRKNGPAIHTFNYYAQIWYQERYRGKHRLDGPQIIYSNGEVEYWVDNNYICDNEKDFNTWKKIQILK